VTTTNKSKPEPPTGEVSWDRVETLEDRSAKIDEIITELDRKANGKKPDKGDE